MVERVNQVDMRFSKIVRLGGTRADIGIDLYNSFNTNDTTAFQQSFDYTTTGATWLNPRSDVAEPKEYRLAAVCALQRDSQLLSHEGHEGHEDNLGRVLFTGPGGFCRSRSH